MTRVGRFAAASLAALLATVAVAGCSDDGQTDEEKAFEAAKDLSVQPTATTGVIRGVVVDATIKPLAGATVALLGASGRDATSNEQGAFGFEGLEPGTYFLRASKEGYNATQTSAVVVAGVAQPDPVRVLLTALPTQPKYFVGYKLNSLEDLEACAVVLGSWTDGGVFTTITGEDNYTIELDDAAEAPAWVQMELVWSPVTPLASTMLAFFWLDGDDAPDATVATGSSPLLATVPAEGLAEMGALDGADLYDVPYCYGMDPALPASIGLLLEQPTESHVHLFFGYTPPPDWRFTAGGDVPAPPA